MSSELARSLLLAGAIAPDALARALFATLTDDVAFEEALLSAGAIDEPRLQAELARWDGPTIQNVTPVPELLARLPRGLCRRLLALPIRLDARTGTVDVAVANGHDPHPAAELGHHLHAPVRAVRAPLAALRRALADAGQAGRGVPPIVLPNGGAAVSARTRKPSRTPLWGTPIVNVDDPPPSTERPIPLVRHAQPPSTVRDPERASLPLPDLAPVLASLENARDRDAVVAIVLSGVRGVARRVAVLVSKRDAIVGWSCVPEFGSATRLQEVRIPSSLPSVFLAVARSDVSYLGPVASTPPHSALLEVAGTLSSDVAIAPLRVAGRCALLVVADELTDPALSTRHIDAISRAAGDALARILRRR